MPAVQPPPAQGASSGLVCRSKRSVACTSVCEQLSRSCQVRLVCVSLVRTGALHRKPSRSDELSSHAAAVRCDNVDPCTGTQQGRSWWQQCPWEASCWAAPWLPWTPRAACSCSRPTRQRQTRCVHRAGDAPRLIPAAARLPDQSVCAGLMAHMRAQLQPCCIQAQGSILADEWEMPAPEGLRDALRRPAPCACPRPAPGRTALCSWTPTWRRSTGAPLHSTGPASVPGVLRGNLIFKLTACPRPPVLQTQLVAWHSWADLQATPATASSDLCVCREAAAMPQSPESHRTRSDPAQPAGQRKLQEGIQQLRDGHIMHLHRTCLALAQARRLLRPWPAEATRVERMPAPVARAVTGAALCLRLLVASAVCSGERACSSWLHCARA